MDHGKDAYFSLSAAIVGWLVTLASAPSACHAAGFAQSDNFTVLAPDQKLANEVLGQAERLRAEHARRWLGEELPPSIGRTTIHVELSDVEDSGLTWAADGTRRTRHKLWLTTTRERALGGTLAHELVHCTLASAYPERLPAWADEGAASLSDDPGRRQTRDRILAWFVRSGQWPDLARLLSAETIDAHDQAAYAAATSLAECLIARRDERAFIAFAAASKTRGLTPALRETYQLDSLEALDAAWREWVTAHVEQR